MSASPLIFNAIDFNYSVVTTSGPNVSGAGTITVKAPLPATANGLPIIINTSCPIIIGGDSNIETVTPTAVSYDQFGNVNITATFSNAHGTGEPVSSASYGLQEAASVANARGGGLVALNPVWRALAAVTTVASMTTQLATWNSVGTHVTVLDYGGYPGSLSYNAASGSAYASTGHTIY
jgi:hypothetical protein